MRNEGIEETREERWYGKCWASQSVYNEIEWAKKACATNFLYSLSNKLDVM